MARGLPGTSLNSARLVRVLADLAVADVVEAKRSMAERLGEWLDFTDAMALFSALNGQAAATAGGALAGTPLHAEFVRVRDTLAESITTDGVFKQGSVRIKLPIPAMLSSSGGVADFSPFHRYYQAHQRDMSAAIGPLRAKARAALAERSPAHGRLAALDAVLDQVLVNRERNLLATVPGLLARRFERLHKAHLESAAESPLPDEPERWVWPGGWLATYCRDMQAVLLAELEVRLQPVVGLIEALGNEVTESQ